MKPLEESQREVLASIAPLDPRRVSLREAHGLVLVEPVVAGHDLPPFPNSAMDGYAVRSDDVATVPVTLRVLEDVPAGSVPGKPVGHGEAIKIMTGAPLPDGADTIVKVEDTVPGDGSVEILVSTSHGTAVRHAGGDIPAGATVAIPGRRLNPADLALLAAVGESAPNVRRRPMVGIMSTGDEVMPPDTRVLGPGKIRDTNRALLRGLIEEAGAVAIDFGIVPDDARTLGRVLAHAAAESDVVVTSGGVSMGEYDLVKQVLSDLGGVDFWKVAMKPAKPFAFGAIDDTPMFGLPGNPVSVMVAFEQFLRPSLLKMMGSERLFRPQLAATAGERMVTDLEKTVFLRVKTIDGETGIEAVTSGGQDSNVLSALAAADAFAVVPRGVEVVDKGDPVTLEMFRWPESRTMQEALGG